MMQAVVENNLYTGYGVGLSNSVMVSHLQFTDDMLLLGDKSWANVRVLRAVLNLFENMSGLKVNFHKSLLVGINIGDSWLIEAAFILNSKVGKYRSCILVCQLEGVRITGKFPRLLGALFVYKRSMEGWGVKKISFLDLAGF
ncbi:hypothetical protein MTR_3g040610 [Medicago truncatula]|uniref:RNA-directed DNA polymerase n=1 Tax=Medicago truncatula TaxID=3880 RepID=A0A072UWR6_MEDTR|nr:hypothetical protein MTR_3g040610 [Medicago truncatula]